MQIAQMAHDCQRGSLCIPQNRKKGLYNAVFAVYNGAEIEIRTVLGNQRTSHSKPKKT